MSKNIPEIDGADPLAALMASVSHDTLTFSYGGYETEVYPVTIIQCLRLVKEFRGLLDIFEARVDKSGKPLPPEMQPTLASILVDAGAAAVAAFVGVAFRRDTPAFREWFASAPDEVTLPMFSIAVKATLGDGGLDDFFTKVLRALAEAGILTLQPDAKAV